MHVVHSRATLFKERKKKTAERVGRGRRGGVLHKFYIHKAADKVIVASPKLFLLPQKTLSLLNRHLLVTPLWAQGS